MNNNSKVNTGTDIKNNFEKNARLAYEQQSETLDSQTLHRLRLAREIALTKQTRASWLPSLNLKWLTGAGASLALASVLTFMIVPNITTNKLSPLDDLEILTAEADLDLVTHMDFYQWIDESALSESTL